SSGTAATGAVGGDEIEGGLNLFRARRHCYVKGIHFDRVTMPGEFLIPRLEVQPGDVRDGPAWAMIPGNPLGIDQRDFSHRRGQRERSMKDVSRSIGEIDRDSDGRS